MDARVMALMIGLLAVGAQADVCRWTDAAGTHFADRAPAGVPAQCQAAPDQKPARAPLPAPPISSRTSCYDLRLSIAELDREQRRVGHDTAEKEQWHADARAARSEVNRVMEAVGCRMD